MKYYVYRGHVFTLRKVENTFQSLIAIDLCYEHRNPFEPVQQAVLNAEKYSPKKGMLKRATKQKNPSILTAVKTKYPLFEERTSIGGNAWQIDAVGILTKSKRQAINESKKIIDQLCEVEESIRSHAMHRQIEISKDIDNNQIPF